MSGTWREAKSLQVLEAEIQEYYPGTTTWEIGDASHQEGWSDHNPNDANAVCAKDVKSDGGLNLQAFTNHLIANPHPNLRYVIFNRKIYQRKNGFAEQDYNGVNAHKTHVHVSVGNGPDGRSTSGYDGTASWEIGALKGKPSKPSKPTEPSKPSTRTTNLEGNMPKLKRGSKGRAVKMLQALLGVWGFKVFVDGIFGKQTEDAVRSFQAKYAKPVDGIVFTVTWNKLLGL